MKNDPMTRMCASARGLHEKACDLYLSILNYRGLSDEEKSPEETADKLDRLFDAICRNVNGLGFELAVFKAESGVNQESARARRDVTLRNGVGTLTEAEFRYATLAHEPYHSPEEGAAIIREEMCDVKDTFKELKKNLGVLEDAVITRDSQRWLIDAARAVAVNSRRLAVNAIHVAGAARKFTRAAKTPSTRYWPGANAEAEAEAKEGA